MLHTVPTHVMRLIARFEGLDLSDMEQIGFAFLAD